jgi:uncharacterized protein
MAENLTISKNPPPFVSMDFEQLRSLGIRHLEKLGTKMWTDFNLHDPGITILEVLCYAITDLGYRTNFPIQDLLAQSANADSAKQFFAPTEILTCNPVTANDFRKILIDLDGIKNAWLLKAQQQEMPLYVKDNLQGLWETTFSPTDKEIRLNGLYKVYLDLEDDVNPKDLDRVNDIVQCAWKKLWEHRNLCEDYVSVAVVEEMDFSIDAQVALCANADVNKVAGDIYYHIQNFLTPTIPFYSFDEMKERKQSCDRIFEGPLLTHGFIDDEDLDKANLRREIYLSDLWQVVMDVCGVAGIKKLVIKKAGESIMEVKEHEVNRVSKWCLTIPIFHKPKLRIDLSTIQFQKEFICLYPDERKVKERIALQQKLNRPLKKSTAPTALPSGMERELTEYFSIQDEFPATYKIAEGQLMATDSVLRQAQVKQLKAYLSLFDQLMANYLVQLSKVKDLLSVSQSRSNSYFYQALYGIPGIKDLLHSFTHQKLNPAKTWEAFIDDDDNQHIQHLQAIIESPTTQAQRKQVFVDHLLARFGESFAEFAAKNYGAQCNCAHSLEGTPIDWELLKTKQQFLAQIPVLSSERGKGFNYKATDCGRPDVWDTNNVEGVKKRVAASMGFEDHQRKTLTCPPEFQIKPYRVITEGRVQAYRLRLEDATGNVLLDGLKEYKQKQNAEKDARELKEQILQDNIAASPPDAKGYNRVQVRDREDNIALQSEMMTAADAEDLLKAIQLLAFPDCCAINGFHVVEHILLRPKDDDYTPLLKPLLISDLNPASPNLLVADGYSFLISVVVPEWLPTFKDNNNAKYRFEQLFRRETPAHVMVRFCWATPKQMYHFETAYLKWLYENALEQPNERELTEHTNQLVALMNHCAFEVKEILNACQEAAMAVTEEKKD